jgi:glycosyltransferase involved in cell wall biosynthesis
MALQRSLLLPLDERGPLRVMFMINDMTVGGAEMLTYEIIRRLDRERFAPELCCMRGLGELGERLRDDVPVFSHVLKYKYDVRVLYRLTRLLRRRKIDAVVTVGAGDRMFWGRLAAWRASVPVVISAIHSTGWPDRIGRLNRLLTPLTDAFIGVAAPHGRYLVEEEGFPEDRVHVIPNGVDTDRFQPCQRDVALVQRLGIPPDARIVGLVAVLRPEKNHELFLRAAAIVRRQVANVHFVFVGDGAQREVLERLRKELGLGDVVHFLGSRRDVPELLPLFDVFALTSKIEASPVSILEAQACGVPVVATRVGSIPDSVLDGQTGLLVSPGSVDEVAAAVLRVLRSPELAASLRALAREHVVSHHSLDGTVRGYEELISHVYGQKAAKVEYTEPATV